MKYTTLILFMLFSMASSQVFRSYISDESLFTKINITKRRHVLRVFYPDSSIEIESEYHNDRRDGLTKEYYPNGRLRSEIYFRNGREDGIARFYYTSGVIHKKIVYKRGEVEEMTLYNTQGIVLKNEEK